MWATLLLCSSMLGNVDAGPPGFGDEPKPAAPADLKAPDQAAEKPDVDQTKALAAYNELRAKTKHTADAQWRLALWCEDHGLKAEAYVHLAVVVKLDPKRLPAWHRLGFKKHNGHWMTDEQIQEDAKQAEADKEWGPKLAKLHKQYHDSKTRAQAEDALAKIEEPRAAPSVFRALGTRGPGDQSLAIQVLGQIKGPYASKSLALLAVYGSKPDVRRRATETLKGRDQSEFIDLLVDLLVNPLKYEVRPVGGPGSPGVLFVEGERFNLQRVYAPPPPPFLAYRSGDFLGYDEFGLPTVYRPGEMIAPSVPITPGDPAALGAVLGKAGISTPRGLTLPAPPTLPGYTTVETTRSVLEIPIGQNLLLARQGAISAQNQLQNDARVVENCNEARGRFNNTVLAVLREVVDQDPGTDRNAWKKWLAEQKGYNEKPKDKPKLVLSQLVPLANSPSYLTRLSSSRFFELIPPDN